MTLCGQLFSSWASCSSISWAREQLKELFVSREFCQSEVLHLESWPMRGGETEICLVNNCAGTPIWAQSSSQNKLFTLRLEALFTQTFRLQVSCSSRPMRGQCWVSAANEMPGFLPCQFIAQFVWTVARPGSCHFTAHNCQIITLSAAMTQCWLLLHAKYETKSSAVNYFHLQKWLIPW